MRTKLYLLPALALLAVSCSREPSVKAYFTVDRTECDIEEEITVENLSSAVGTVIGMCKWEWDGRVSYEYDLGTIGFNKTGEYTVTLTVYADEAVAGPDTYSVTVKIIDSTAPPVEPGDHKLTVEWEREYDSGGVVYWTSPALNSNGTRIYVSSTAYNLVCYDALGNEKGRFDIGYKGAMSRGADNQSPTPSVDDEGNVYIPVQFDNSGGGNGGVFSIKADCAGENWYSATGAGSSYQFLCPAIYDDYILVTLRGNDSGLLARNGGVLDRQTGEKVASFYANQGSYGGIAVASDGKVVYGTSNGNLASSGYQVCIPTATDTWTSTNTNAQYYLMNNIGFALGSQPAIGSDGRVYLCVSQGGNEVVCGCFDLSAYVNAKVLAPIWTAKVDCPEGMAGQNGYGMVLDGEGNAYLLTGSKIVRLGHNDGSVEWEHTLIRSNESPCIGVPAIDSNGYLYVCVPARNKLVKISSADGRAVSEVELSNPKSCPTISPDGSIYVTGNNNGKTMLYKVRCPATTAPGLNWSQLGSNHQKKGLAPEVGK